MCEFDLIMQAASARKVTGLTGCDSYFDRGLTEPGFVKPGQTQSRSVKPSQSNFFPLFLCFKVGTIAPRRPSFNVSVRTDIRCLEEVSSSRIGTRTTQRDRPYLDELNQAQKFVKKPVAFKTRLAILARSRSSRET